MERSSTIAELMERRRIQAGAKEYQGHTYMDLARFDEATKHMMNDMESGRMATCLFFPMTGSMKCPQEPESSSVF